MDTIQKEINDPKVEAMFSVGAQYGYSKRKRHPSVKDLIFGIKNRVEIWNLEKTIDYLEKAVAYAKSLGKEGKQILFVGGKSEAKNAIKEMAVAIGQPYVAGRWIGGTLTNYAEIRSRVNKYEKLLEDKEKGEFLKYTKKERMLIDKDIEKLERNFKGLVAMKGMPSAIFIIDPKAEHIALSESKKAKIKSIALLNTDCDIRSVDYPIPGNDSSMASIKFFIEKIAGAYEEGVKDKASSIPE
ncbi:MAG: 30S ribosomal protein S2 [Patescibacteria group bacterium]